MRLFLILSLLMAVVLPASEQEWRQLIQEGDECWTERDLECARKRFEQALNVAETTFALDDPRGGDTLKRLAYVADAMERPDLAEDYHRQALAAYVMAYGDDTEPVLEQERVLALWYRDNNRLADAVSRFRTLLNKRRIQDNAEPRDIAIASYELGDALLRQERYGEAALLLKEAREPAEEAFGPESQGLRIVLDRLARAQLAIRDMEGEIATLETLLELEQALLGEDADAVTETENRLAQARQQMNAVRGLPPGPPLAQVVEQRMEIQAESLERLQYGQDGRQMETGY